MWGKVYYFRNYNGLIALNIKGLSPNVNASSEVRAFRLKIVTNTH